MEFNNSKKIYFEIEINEISAVGQYFTRAHWAEVKACTDTVGQSPFQDLLTLPLSNAKNWAYVYDQFSVHGKDQTIEFEETD